MKSSASARPTFWALLLVLALLATAYYAEEFRPASAGAALHSVGTRQRGVRSAAAVGGSGGGRASLVWILLGETQFQPYVLESVAQARLFNAETAFFLVVDKALASAAGWDERLNALAVERVDPSEIEDDFGREFSAAFLQLWEVGFAWQGFPMLPVYEDKANFLFMQYSTTRLITLLQLISARSLGNVVHMENDQMLYGSIQTLSDAADACGVRLAMPRYSDDNLAASVLFVRTAADLRDMLDFFLFTINQGSEHAMNVTKTFHVTDMTMSAAYFTDAKHRFGGAGPVQTLPNSGSDTCVGARSGFMFDAGSLSQWCCGIHTDPWSRFSHKNPWGRVPYWDAPFEWQLLDLPIRLRVPFWNGTRVFNLHMHSKQLHLWRSTDSDISMGWNPAVNKSSG